MKLRNLFQTKTEEKVDEALHILDERSEHFRRHIHNINERLNNIDQRLDRLIVSLEKMYDRK